MVWRVIVQDTSLSVTPDANFEELNWRYGQFLLGLGLTQLIELLVAGLYLWLVIRVDSEPLVNRLIMIFLINLVTFPVVWFVFPSLSQSQFTPMRPMGIFSLIAAALYAFSLVYIIYAEGKTRRQIIILAAIWLPLALILAIVPSYYGYMFMTSTLGRFFVSAFGLLPPNMVILASEIFAVASEAALIYILSRKSLPLRQAGTISLLMNAASFFFCLAAVGI